MEAVQHADVPVRNDGKDEVRSVEHGGVEVREVVQLIHHFASSTTTAASRQHLQH